MGGGLADGAVRTPADQPVFRVQNYLEKAAQNLKPLVPIKFCISSRPDAGVHALCNSTQVDIQKEAGKPPFPGSILVSSLNHWLKSEEIQHLNVPATQQAVQFLLGIPDFSTFRSICATTPPESPVKTFIHVDIRPFSSFLSYHYIQSHIFLVSEEEEAPSFAERPSGRFHYPPSRQYQMVGVLVAVGQGKLKPYRIKELLEASDLLAYPRNTIAPAAGLFLKSVEYDDADLQAAGAAGE